MRQNLILVSLFMSACGANEAIRIPNVAGLSPSEFGFTEVPTGSVGSVQVLTDTYFKVSTAQSSTLSDASKCFLPHGTALEFSSQGSDSDGHVAIQLTVAPPGCGFSSGYFYKAHVSITLSYFISVTQATKFKVSTAQSGTLQPNEVCSMPAARYSLIDPPVAEGDHFRVSLKPNQLSCGFESGYVYAGHASVEGAQQTSGSALGAWIFLISETGYTHAQLAKKLTAIGIKRVYIKIADGTRSCSLFPESCSSDVPKLYKDQGISPWAWSYNYPGSDSAQANAATLAASYGYEGYVIDVESEFSSRATALGSLAQAFANATHRAHIPLYATTFSNAEDHNISVATLDAYVDAHMPQTYIEYWGGRYLSDPVRTVHEQTCEYRRRGATKPIHHIVSLETNVMTSAELRSFLQVSGLETSLWVVPGGGVSKSNWNYWTTANLGVSKSEAQCL